MFLGKTHATSFGDPHLLTRCRGCCTVPATAPIWICMELGLKATFRVRLWSKRRDRLSYVRLKRLVMPC